MFLAAVLISGQDWLIPGAILLAVVLLLLAWSYRRAPGGGGLRALCLLLKLLGVLALAACLLEPLDRERVSGPARNQLAVLADNSQDEDRGPRRRPCMVRT